MISKSNVLKRYNIRRGKVKPTYIFPYHYVELNGSTSIGSTQEGLLPAYILVLFYLYLFEYILNIPIL